MQGEQLTDFRATISKARFVLAEGSLIEHIHRGTELSLDEHIGHAGFIYDSQARVVLEEIYRQYIEIGRRFCVPMILGAPTWRANPDRLRAAGFSEKTDVNGDGVRFVQAIRDNYGEYAARIYIGGLMACKRDAYQPEGALSETDAAAFHAWQARALSRAGADFLHAATLPSVEEAAGLAKAMATCGLPYVLSFVLRPSGTLLDGTPLSAAIERIDGTVDPPPFAYMVNCVHPRVFLQALEHEASRTDVVSRRVIGLQANTSELSPEELSGLDVLAGDDPERFAESMSMVYRQFGTKVLGGCCGTDPRHIACIAERIVGPAPCQPIARVPET